MARGREQAQPNRILREDELVAKLAPDPTAASPDAIMLSGFLGRSAEEGRWRLYLKPDLSDYVEIDDADILNQQPLAVEQSTLGGSAVWVRRGAKLARRQTVTQEVQADFLAGELSGTYLPESDLGMAEFAPLTVTVTRTTTLITKPTVCRICPSVVCTPTCITVAYCPSKGCPSEGCPTPVKTWGPGC